jgi:hypothetical protein
MAFTYEELKELFQRKIDNPNLRNIKRWKIVKQDEKETNYLVKYSEVVCGIKGEDSEEITLPN